MLLRPKNKETVRSNPTEAVGKEIWTVIIEASNKYSYEEKMYSHLITELSTHSVFEKQLLRIRAQVINEFYPM